jgi:small subunit ribosomal protein S6
MALDIHHDFSHVKNMYETTFLVGQGLDEAEYQKVAKKFETLIREGEGDIINIEHWGKKPLAYQIERNTHAYYCYIEFNSPGSLIGKLEQEFLYDESVIRYLSVRVEKHHAAFNTKRREHGFGNKKKEEAK